MNPKKLCKHKQKFNFFLENIEYSGFRVTASIVLTGESKQKVHWHSEATLYTSIGQRYQCLS